MRRPILLIFILVYIFCYLYDHFENQYNDLIDKKISVSGYVHDIKRKNYYVDLYVDKYILRCNKSHIQIGDYINASGKFKSIDNIKIKDFDYGRYLKSIGVKAIINVNYIDFDENKNNIYYYSNRVKKYIINSFDIMYRMYSQFASALIVGGKLDDKDLNDAFSKTGTSHIMALSGYNISIVVAILFFIMRKINSIKKMILINIILIFYCFVGNLSPSIIRASIFASLVFLAVFIKREYDCISALSFIGILFLMLNTYIIYNISFLLSFLATLSIALFYKTINDKIKFPLVSVTLSANILTLPIIYYNFKIVSLVFLIANMLILPTMSVLTILIILSLLFFALNIKIYTLFSYISICIIKYIFFICDYLASLKFSFITFKTVSLKFVIIYYAVIFMYSISKEIRIVKEQKNELYGYNKENEKKRI